MPFKLHTTYLNEDVFYVGYGERRRVGGTIFPEVLVDEKAMLEDFGYRYKDSSICVKVRGRSVRLPYETGDIRFTDYMTMGCNYSCPYCYIGSPEYTRSGRIKTELFVPASRRLELVRALMSIDRVSEMTYTMMGGEPTLYVDFDKLVEGLMNTQGIKINLYTNLSRRHKVISLIGRGYSSDRIFVHASAHPSAPEFDEESFFENLTALIDAGIRSTVSLADTPENKHQNKESRYRAFNVRRRTKNHKGR